jgi:hypothetical protein
MFQAFNLFNRANYGNSFANVIQTGPGAAAPFAQPNNFFNPTSSTLARSFQGEFGARFTF